MTETIDLEYRPSSYFRPQPLEEYVLSRVKGALMKAHLRELLAADQQDEVARLLREEGVPEDEVRALGGIHPLFMGGNYLPNPRPGEVEIARIFIESTTGDVTAVYAQPHEGRIRYRVVDEYSGGTLRKSKARLKADSPAHPRRTVRLLHRGLAAACGAGHELPGRRGGHARVLRRRVGLLPGSGRAMPSAGAGGLPEGG
jgi:hypothetical protein